MNEIRSTDEVISELKDLLARKGYIYAFCMIIFEDFHINPEKLHDIDNYSRISVNEASLIFGFILQIGIDYSYPDSHGDVISMKRSTYKLLEDLHMSFMGTYFDKLKVLIGENHDEANYRHDQKEFFGDGKMLIEPIFYGGTGVYDFQYLEFLERKYKYDKQLLLDNRNFDIDKVKAIVPRIKDILYEKSKLVNLYELRDKKGEIMDKFKNDFPNEQWQKHAEEILPMIEFHQYVNLFLSHDLDPCNATKDQLKVTGWKSFYEGLINLFVISKSDFDEKLDINSFLDNFSISIEAGLNSQFHGVGNFNIFEAKPIIKLDDDRYFVPISFIVYKAVYESPFYWMKDGDKLLQDSVKNRGKVGEDIAYEFLSSVFGIDKTFKGVKVKENETIMSTTRKKDSTDIDVLCILGSKALVVQVKSKKLTELSKTGNDAKLKEDFQKAVQDAYAQGLKCRDSILNQNAQFVDGEGNELVLSEGIDEVYIMGLTTEDYPSLTHQAHILLDKNENDPYPIFMTVFDLELVVHYLKDPYDFLYYIRQRISTIEYFKAGEEMIFLGYHLDQKLRKLPSADFVALDQDFGQIIDRNYYPIKAGLDVSDDGDAIKNVWKHKDFEDLCNQLKIIGANKITDIIFHLLDRSGEARINLVKTIKHVKSKTLSDGKFHSFSMPPDPKYSPSVGVTYISLESDDEFELKERLLALCKARKYKSKGDVWIGFGSLKSSTNIIDLVVYNDDDWHEDESMEALSKILLEGKSQGRFIRIGKKVGRNNKCPCGSNLKYKKCCGKNH